MYPNGYTVVYYPDYQTVLFSWDSGRAYRGTGAIVILENAIIRTINAGGLILQYEKVFKDKTPVYFRETHTDVEPEMKN